MDRAYALIDWLMPVIVTAVACTAMWGPVAWVVANELGAWGRLALFFGLPLACAYWCGREHGRRRRG